MMWRHDTAPSAGRVWAVSATLVAMLAVMQAGPARAQELAVGDTISGVAEVIDGNRLELDGQRLYLAGINAPRARQKCDAGGTDWLCGARARRRLEDMAAGKEVICEIRSVPGEQAESDRGLPQNLPGGECQTESKHLNAEMVRQGLAGLRRSREGQRYTQLAEQARAEGLGVWRHRQ